MGHKPDQKARRKRREREAAKAAPPPKPPFTASELIGRKRTESKANRADFLKKLAAAPPKVQSAYHACRQKIRKTHRLKVPGAPKPIVATLYDPKRSSRDLSPTEIAWLFDLLSHRSQGWDVSLSKELESGAKPSVIYRLW